MDMIMSSVGGTTTSASTATISPPSAPINSSHVTNNGGNSNNNNSNIQNGNNGSNTGGISSGLSGANSANNNGGIGPDGTEDLTTLEAEISELQRENARVESQMMRLKSDINAMESQLGNGDRDPPSLASLQRGPNGSNNLNNYYESLRNNVITLLEHVRIPPGGGPPPVTSTAISNIHHPNVVGSNAIITSGGYTYAHSPLITPGPLATSAISQSIANNTIGPLPPGVDKVNHHHPPPPHHHHEHFDSYISKLQSLCAPPATDIYGLTDNDNRPVYDTVKTALQDYTVLPTPI